MRAAGSVKARYHVASVPASGAAAFDCRGAIFKHRPGAADIEITAPTATRSGPILRKFLLPALAALSPLAQAGRPLSTDDAGVADTATCQVEAWSERGGGERAFVVAPACGVLAGVELGADCTLPKPRDVVRAEGGLAAKWVPAAWKLDSALGAMNFGFKS